jgi:hypothetical protein
VTGEYGGDILDSKIVLIIWTQTSGALGLRLFFGIRGFNKKKDRSKKTKKRKQMFKDNEMVVVKLLSYKVDYTEKAEDVVEDDTSIVIYRVLDSIGISLKLMDELRFLEDRHLGIGLFMALASACEQAGKEDGVAWPEYNKPFWGICRKRLKHNLEVLKQAGHLKYQAVPRKGFPCRQLAWED